MTTPDSELTRRNHELSVLNKIAQALNSEVDLDRALRTALNMVVDLLALQTGWVWLLDDNGDSYLAAQQQLPPGLADHPWRMEGSCYCLDTFRDGDLDGAANVSVVTCTRLKNLDAGTGGLRYHASIPVYAHGRKLGVLNVASTDWRELSPEDLQLLYTIGDMLGIAVERARLFTQSAQLGALQERNRLARELHDTLAQGVSGVALQLETADALLDAGASGDKVQAALQMALKSTRASLEDLRRSVLDLRAAPLEGRSLAEALAALVETWRQRSRWEVVLESAGCNRPLPARVEAGLYRVAQEALNNVAQHADAGYVRVKLICTPDDATLWVTDDGRGFNTDAVDGRRFGLLGMNERVRLLDGEMMIESTPGEGTVVHVWVPLVNSEGADD